MAPAGSLFAGTFGGDLNSRVLPRMCTAYPANEFRRLENVGFTRPVRDPPAKELQLSPRALTWSSRKNHLGIWSTKDYTFKRRGVCRRLRVVPHHESGLHPTVQPRQDS